MTTRPKAIELAAEMQRYGVTTMNRWATDGAQTIRTQHAEIERLEAVNAGLLACLSEISELDPEKHSSYGYNEWGEAECFDAAQSLARAAIKKAEAKS